VDNILDYGYFKDFIPALAAIRKEKEFDLFYEVKANLTKEQLRNMKLAGITTIQPGIESFCKKTLKLMRKGVSPIQNIQLLKWCKELNISVEWNLLYGFPHENMEEYAEVARLLPLLSHLSPPNGFAPIRLDRFSPNFNQSQELGFKEIKPYPTYSYIYPFEPAEIQNLAYFFTYEYQQYTLDTKKMKTFSRTARQWRKKHNESALFYSDNGSEILVWDLRPAALHPVYILEGLTREIYLLCDRCIRLVQCIEKIQKILLPAMVTADDITAKLNFLTENKLMIFFDDHYLSLAISDTNIQTTKKVAGKINNLVSTEPEDASAGLTLTQTIFA
jgi:ribosomal peptide maturation radical SAM protein 1